MWPPDLLRSVEMTYWYEASLLSDVAGSTPAQPVRQVSPSPTHTGSSLSIHVLYVNGSEIQPVHMLKAGPESAFYSDFC